MSDNHYLHDERLSKLYNMGDSTEPPAHIDAEIKQTARDAVMNKKRSFAWPSLATAAVLVLSLSLMLKVLDQQPLEESVMEPMQADDQAMTPEIMLQERDKEKPVLKRYEAKRRSIAPAPPKPETEDTAQFDAAPAASIGETISSSLQQLDCSDISMPEAAPKEEWISQYQKALEQGQIEAANCLKQAFQIKFNRVIPEPNK